MEPNPALGVLLHAIGGLMAASFYIPLKRVRNWSWESYWLVQGFAAWLIVPMAVAYLTVPNLPYVMACVKLDHSTLRTYFFGVLWGIGGLTFGLSMRYLGMSLGYALALGFCAMVGTVTPYYMHDQAGDLMNTAAGRWQVLGIMVCLAGIAVCAFAGSLKEKEMTIEEKRVAIKEFALTKGILVAVFAGVMSACMALALDAGAPIAQIAIDNGAPKLLSNNAVLVVVLAGGFTSNFIWCIILNFINKSFKDYVSGGFLMRWGNVLLAALGGMIWYFQFFFYGMGQTKMGPYGYASWTIHMAFIVAFSNVWALLFREWKGSGRKTIRFVYAGITVLVLSTVVVGVGYYVADQAKKAAEARDELALSIPGSHT